MKKQIIDTWGQAQKSCDWRQVSNFELPAELFTWLKKACKQAKQKASKANTSLVGHIKEEYHLITTPTSGETVYHIEINKNFIEFLLQCTDSTFCREHLNNIKCLSSSKPLYVHDLWVNYMKKHEFNPPHNHSGALSFVIFVKIPYDLQAEENQFTVNNQITNPSTGKLEKSKSLNFTSKFTFHNTESDGTIHSECLSVDKSFEGKMLMFPSAQIHEVFPFYTSDNYRITVSGNIRIKV